MSKQQEYTPHTLSNGHVVLCRRVSPFLGQAVAQQFPEPLAPVQRVNYGTPEAPDWQQEPNPSHPAYLVEMKAYNIKLQALTNRFFLKRGVRIEWTPEKRAALEELKAECEAEGVTLKDDDQYTYIQYIVCDSVEVFNELVDLIVGASTPKEEAIQSEVNGFRAEVQGT